MKDYLVFTLYGPMSVWGGTAVGEIRPGDDHPTKSAVVGLLAAALGVKRDEESMHVSLVESLGLAVRVDVPGTMIRDYHTVQAPARERKTVYTTRSSALARGGIHTLISKRDYLCDACFTACVWETGDCPVGLSQLVEALERPKFVLYLGRKSCPPGLPLAGRVITATSFKEALDNYEIAFDVAFRLRDGIDTPIVSFYWEGESDGIEPIHTITRCDALLSRKRWQFGTRREHYFSEERG